MLRSLILTAALVLAGCGDPPVPFRNTDITGAEYGAGLRLTDHHGTPRTLADYRGKVVAVFFGYTQCPDVCPTVLSTMSGVMQELGAEADQVQVLFVTVDPERDTQELLAAYVPQFDARFVGLYGDAVQTAAIAKEFRVFYQKAAGGGEHYTVDHSTGTFLFDPQGRARLYVRHGEAPQNIAADIRLLLSGK